MTEDFSKYNGEGTNLRRAQLRMLDILVVVDKICKANEIPYWLDYGTLLGAVRHKGFIPWDDDLDISCLSKDYWRLCEVLKEQLPSNLVYQDWNNEKKLVMKMGKVRDKNSYFEEALYAKGVLKHQGIYIDIFPLVRIPSLAIRKNIDFFYGRSLRRIRGFSASKRDLILAYLIYPFARILILFSNFLGLFLGKGKLSNMYGSITHYCEHNIDDIFPLQKITFEGLDFFAPNKLDKYLTDIYNDYMTIPQEDNRQTHASNIEFYD